jgi:hypothetical protein
MATSTFSPMKAYFAWFTGLDEVSARRTRWLAAIAKNKTLL